MMPISSDYGYFPIMYRETLQTIAINIIAIARTNNLSQIIYTYLHTCVFYLPIVYSKIGFIAIIVNV